MIIISAKEDDTHALKVASLLKARHAQDVFIFDTSRFPGSIALNGSFGNGNSDLLLLPEAQRYIRLQEVTSIWWRRPQPMGVDPRVTDPIARNFAFQECVSALYGILECCDTLWVNDIQRDVAAEYKPFQLKVAARHEFIVPETLVTNVREAVLDFWNCHNRAIVYKSFNQRAVAWRPTRILREEDLPMLEHLCLAPVIFQAMVPGIRDVRVTVIGDQIFASEFDIERLPHVDYRMHMGDIQCRPHQLPANLETRIRSFMSDLGLEYGGIDFRLSSDQQYVFFEINTAGEFMYVQDRTGQPLAEAMAAHLAGGKPAQRKPKPAA